MNKISNICTLSPRQVEILRWLSQGKTASETALILGVADVTVRKHIINIKNKSGCHTMFQLGEYFSKLYWQSNHIIKNDN